MVTAWRIVKRKHVRTAFSGEGARRFGGRWNSAGVAVVYTSQSQSLAALEMAVHLDSSELLDRYVVFKVEFDESLITQVDPRLLPRNWKSHPPPSTVRAIGDAWAAAGTTAVLRVPSATVPGESNFLLNPLHQDFTQLKIGNPSPFRFDPRLAEK